MYLVYIILFFVYKLIFKKFSIFLRVLSMSIKSLNYKTEHIFFFCTGSWNRAGITMPGTLDLMSLKLYLEALDE